MQSCLERASIQERTAEIVKSDYNVNDQYSAAHIDAISDGDVHGKGTLHGGHTAYLPDCTKGPSMIDYSNFDTENGGGFYDIEGRNDIGGRLRAMASSLYNKDNPYSSNLVDTSINAADGQFQIS